MLLDISPLCLYHNVPMIVAQEKRDPERILDPTYHWYACSVRGCILRYDTRRGYHTIEHDDLDPFATNRTPVMSVPIVFIWQSVEERLEILSGFARTRSVPQINGSRNSQLRH
jgi:hypothetical protein